MSISLTDLDATTGYHFEKVLASVIRSNGYSEVKVTKASQDYGVDLIAKKNGLTYCFQAKRYSKPVGITAVQEVHSAVGYYGADHGVVITNQTFTRNAQKLADKLGIKLVDRAELGEWLKHSFKEVLKPVKPRKPQVDALRALDAALQPRLALAIGW